MVISGMILLVTTALAGPDPLLSGGTVAGPDTSCVVMDMPTGGRRSPLDSLTLSVGGAVMKVCYGRPAAQGRTMIGGREVPFGKLWRTGANEPTMIHTTGTIAVAGIEVPAGSYSLYTIPGEEEWRIIINRSITQWGHIARYTSRVKAEEVGQAVLRRSRPEQHVEVLTFRAEHPSEGPVQLILEWEDTRIVIPVEQTAS